MPRQDFLNGIEICQKTPIKSIVNIQCGNESDTVTFTYLSELLPSGLANVQAIIPEPFDYPSRHVYILFVENHENVPPQVTAALAELSPELSGKDLRYMMQKVSEILTICLSEDQKPKGGKADLIILNGDSDDDDAYMADDRSESSTSDAMEDNIDDDYDIYLSGDTTFKNSDLPVPRAQGIDMSRIESDLRAAKEAGFKVGVLGDLTTCSIAFISIRTVKLGISEEAMQAWGLQKKHYLVLMIKFDSGYRTLEQVSEMGTLKSETEMHVGLCCHYKPTFEEAMIAFATAKKADRHDSISNISTHSSDLASSNARKSIEPIFIGKPLNELLRARFPTIVKYRLACGFSWGGAELFFHDVQGIRQGDVTDNKYYESEQSNGRALKDIVKADAVAGGVRPLSLPLVAMQFLLRHFVRCTEFCLVCHCRVDYKFEALKPYVCSKPLCLYQYINLGFGPNIEWEVLTQPCVVDLLISFCYVSAHHGRLNDFPTGLNLIVPIFAFGQFGYEQMPRQFKVTYSGDSKQLVFDQESYPECPVSAGTLMVLRSKEWNIHCRVHETSFYPTVTVDSCIVMNVPRHQMVSDTQPMNVQSIAEVPPNFANAVSKVRCYPYEHKFDELPNLHKQQSIKFLLDTLPSVTAMRQHLLSTEQNQQQPTLRGIMTEPALNLLRWIIASNRSCIMQVDQPQEKHPGCNSQSVAVLSRPEDRVGGMDGWMQFRFAQGAPDKEQRFIDSVNALTGSSEYPTLFAWHGSPLGNWHGIIREGLQYNLEVLHGRVYGDGVYMSNLATTSRGYCGYLYKTPHSKGSAIWPQSVLKIREALSLQEVVNSPSSFHSKSPFYVVQQIDWIQTRYLFVKCDGAHAIVPDTTASQLEYYNQDPDYRVFGETSNVITIPITAVSKSHRPAESKSNELVDDSIEDDASSMTSDLEDRLYLESAILDVTDKNYDDLSSGSSKNKRHYDGSFVPSKRLVTSICTSDHPKTDFEPGQLDIASLKTLSHPLNASGPTSKELMKRLIETLKVQDSSPLHDLGWYIDQNLITNLYQWIVELHSFDPDLPLAKDMKAANQKSIVLELRFTNSFPFSPPFVRVVRPRFLPFLSGGGGHVTAGGAICMELLTNNGWLPTYSIESVLLQIRVAMSSLHPRPARLQWATGNSYTVGEAMDAYRRACLTHGWKIPDDFHTLQKE